MSLRIGLTGGIGSGKSTVAKVFEVLGVPLYYADDAARSIMNNDPELREQIIAHFGADMYDHGILNRKKMGAIVFNDPEKLKLINSLVHPATIRDGERWMDRQTAPYAIKEAAIIFESGTQSQLDYVIGVSAPDALRIHRTMQRDKITREEVITRMNKQIQQKIKMMLCDFVIVNDEQNAVIPQVMQLHEQLLALAGAAVAAAR
ncbi:dephospho-CoA kinase [Paraflavitalea sp. CAU 1676]|uniref:dephospho-CoA kinase n=1 Tax=Paraflavitalea sp. CAU 1676 TaxID=3032598 RepID=UPI0023DA02D4|nr:dephospho-CoA kinase [Paraflavitalea sp. CAU 1676]MDF2187744.1 dephospho-CoA kinase [Paraflavitalea sp. CAU 1676]